MDTQWVVIYVSPEDGRTAIMLVTDQLAEAVSLYRRLVTAGVEAGLPGGVQLHEAAHKLPARVICGTDPAAEYRSVEAWLAAEHPGQHSAAA